MKMITWGDPARLSTRKPRSSAGVATWGERKGWRDRASEKGADKEDVSWHPPHRSELLAGARDRGHEDVICLVASARDAEPAEATGICSNGRLRENQLSHGSDAVIPISMLVPADSPRLAGENDDHIRILAESKVTFPPIIVNRATMRVIDGMHRLRVAALRGQDEIEVQFFDGNDLDSFVLGVEANITHGLPLSLDDRTRAAARIIDSRPEWSDRLIASKTGLAAKTVGAIRRRSTGKDPQLNTRIGRDGRVRPLSTAGGRRIASELIKNRPDAPLREIASEAGISLGTAQDVRQRVRRGEDPVRPKQRNGEQLRNQSRLGKLVSSRDGRKIGKTSNKDRALLLHNLKKDPSLRFADAGRILLRLLHPLAISPQEWDHLIDNVPGHCRPAVSDAAHACAIMWQEFAEQLERR